MPTKSRVNNALPRRSAGEGLAFKQLVGIEKTALLGNGLGAIYVPSPSDTTNYGKVWIRLQEGVGENNESLTSPPKRAIATGSFYPAENMTVKVRENPVTGVYEVIGNDVLGAAQRGLNTNGLNPQNPSNNEIWTRQIRNMRSFIPTSNTTSSTKISIEPYLYIYDGTVKDATKGQSDNIDLASYIPSAGNERLVGVGTKASDNTVQIVSGTTRTISSAKWSLADIQAIYDDFDSDIMGVEIWHLKDAQTSIGKTDKRFDLRQFINLPSASIVDSTLGYPNPVTTAMSVSTGRQLIVKAPFEVSAGGSVAIESGSSLVILPKDIEQQNTPKIVTSSYTITRYDRTILANASGGTITIALPDSATVTSKRFDIKAINVSGGSVTITSTDNIDGSASDIVINTAYESITLEAINGDYYIL